MPGSCPEQSTHERTDGLTNVLPPKRRISPSTDAHARGLIHLDIQASCKGCDWTQTGPKAATQFDHAARLHDAEDAECRQCGDGYEPIGGWEPKP